MNKWQIICPAVAMLLFGALLTFPHWNDQSKALRAAIESHLRSVLDELEHRQESGRYPSLPVAQNALQDPAVANRVHITSLFGTANLCYNPTQPKVGSDALIVGARIQNRLFAIQGDRKVQLLTGAELERTHLVPLTGATNTSPSPAAIP